MLCCAMRHFPLLCFLISYPPRLMSTERGVAPTAHLATRHAHPCRAMLTINKQPVHTTECTTLARAACAWHANQRGVVGMGQKAARVSDADSCPIGRTSRYMSLARL